MEGSGHAHETLIYVKFQGLRDRGKYALTSVKALFSRCVTVFISELTCGLCELLIVHVMISPPPLNQSFCFLNNPQHSQVLFPLSPHP